MFLSNLVGEEGPGFQGKKEKAGKLGSWEAGKLGSGEAHKKFKSKCVIPRKAGENFFEAEKRKGERFKRLS